jgi:hypothetical protein
MLFTIIKLNGIYDILCAMCILKIIDIPIVGNLHLQMLYRTHPELNPLVERFFAYWIFTYGIIRLGDCKTLIPYSYYIEAAFITNEIIHQTMDKQILTVAASSLFLGVMSHYLK